MKLRSLFVLAIFAVLLSACNLTLAADVTPPPDYIAPTLMPPLASYPPALPDVRNGEAIYAQKCLPCHGPTGLGDGPQGKQLPVTVAPIGLPDFARKAQPSAWYQQVTRGNIERMMPPFVSLSDQERWDVVAYALTIHIAPGQVEKGKELFETNCSGCAAKFSNPEKMYSLSENDLINIMKNGEGDIPAFGKNFSDDETAAVAAYLRSLTFSASAAEPTASPAPEATATVAATSSPEVTSAAESATPSAAVTPVDVTPSGTESATPETTAVPAPTGNIKGKIVNKTGKPLPANTMVTLYGYEHGGDPGEPPKEVVKLKSAINADGGYLFEGIDLSQTRIFVAEIVLDGIPYDTEAVTATPEMTEIVFPDITVYEITSDLKNLETEHITIHLDFSNYGEIKATVIYSMYNKSGKTVLVKLENEGKDIPFIKPPANSNISGYQQSGDSASFVGTQDRTGFYMPPSEKVYGLIMVTTIPGSQAEYSQKIVLDTGNVSVLVPEGVTLSGDQFKDEGLNSLQSPKGKTESFRIYTAADVKAGETITFNIEGQPLAGSNPNANPADSKNNNLLIIVAGLGLVLIAIGAWLFIRDQKMKAEDEEDEDEEDDDEGDAYADQEDVMDAIIALDDLHRAGKLSDEAYQKRRDELKGKLKK
jgi:mono/diheme cytochrome c family protein